MKARLDEATLYTPQEIEHLGEEAVADLLFRALGGERVVVEEPPRPTEDDLIREAVQHVRASVDEITRFGIDARRLMIRMLRRQLAYESKTLS